jgi:hypothetical protein
VYVLCAYHHIPLYTSFITGDCTVSFVAWNMHEGIPSLHSATPKHHVETRPEACRCHPSPLQYQQSCHHPLCVSMLRRRRPSLHFICRRDHHIRTWRRARVEPALDQHWRSARPTAPAAGTARRAPREGRERERACVWRELWSLSFFLPAPPGGSSVKRSLACKDSYACVTCL